MIWELCRIRPRSWVMFVLPAVLFVIASPAVMVAAGETPGAATVAALTLALCALIAVTVQRALRTGPVVGTSAPNRRDLRVVRTTTDVADPPRHPLCPRAPGLA